MSLGFKSFLLFNLYQLLISVNGLYFMNDENKSNRNTIYPVVERRNFEKLLFILDAKNFQPEWMANKRPTKIFEQGQEGEPNGNLKIMSSFMNYTLFDEQNKTIPLDTRMTSALKRWIVKQAHCSVDYIWKLERQYWPMWIRHGICRNRGSCSWPPGMSCRTNTEKRLTLLHWNCVSDPKQRIWKEISDKVEANRQRRRQRRERRAKRTGKTRYRRRRHRRRRNNAYRNPKRVARKKMRFQFKTSKYIDGFYCQWEPKEFKVVNSCLCSCR